MLATASGAFAALYAYFQEDADMGINSVGDRKRVERALYHNGDDRPGQTEERRVYELIALMAKVVVIARVAKSKRMSCPASGPRRTKSA